MLDIWGGHECTVNRIGERFRDQNLYSGHQDRPGDIALFSALGLRTLRYPVLWERISPDDPELHDWAWTDRRMGDVKRRGIRPIVGLLHHGSGPRYTSLVSDNFVPGLATPRPVRSRSATRGCEIGRRSTNP